MFVSSRAFDWCQPFLTRWSENNLIKEKTLTFGTPLVRCIVYCLDLSMVITGSEDRTVRVWDVATGDSVHVLTKHTSFVWCAAVHGTTYVNCVSLIVD